MLLTHLQTAVITVLLRDPFALLKERGRCSQEAEETSDGQGELAGRFPEGKTPDFTQGQGECDRSEKSKKSNGKKSSKFARKKEGKKGESTDQGTKDD